MTRNTHQENLLKCETALAETKPFDNISNQLDNNPLLTYNLPMGSKLEKEITLPEFNNELTSNIENPMTKLYNLEKKEIKSIPIKINLDLDLYQMEDY